MLRRSARPMPRSTPLRSMSAKRRKRMEGPTERASRAERPMAKRAGPVPQVRSTYAGTTAGPAPKEDLLQHQGYMRLVRTFPCERCGRAGPSEFAHADQGKGSGIKSDCREGTSLCGYRSPEDPGCHWLVGTKRIYPKQQRRELERGWAANTRARVRRLGLWPKRLPIWED